MIDDLLKLGLTATEGTTLLTLIKIGPTFAAPLIKQSGLHRQLIYRALDQLEAKGLVTRRERNGKHYFLIGDLDRLLTEQEVKTTLAKSIIMRLKSATFHDQEIVRIFSGKQSYYDGLADFRRKAEENLEYIVIGGQSEDWYQFTQDFFPEHVEELRRIRKQGAVINILFFASERRSAEKYIAPYLNDPYIVKITSQAPRIPHTAWLSGNHVYILTPTAQPLVVHFHSRPLANEFRLFYTTLWTSAEFLE